MVTLTLRYVLDRYVACLTGRSHVDLPDEEKRRMKLEKGENIDPNKEFVNPGLSEEIPSAPAEHVHLTTEELRGIKFIVMFLQQLPDEAKEVPVLIPDPAALVRAVREMVGQHAGDCPRRAVTGRYVLRWTEDDDVDEDSKSRKIIPKPSDYSGAGAENPFHQKYLRAMAGRSEGARRGQEAPRKRRARCQTCAGCAGSDCQECAPCRDMPKHGGPGRVKQSCVKRRCARPTLPLAAACSACGLDGWGGPPDPRRLVEDGRPSTLLECLLCWDVRHKECGEEGGTVLTRLSNSWECPACSTGAATMDTS
jgi:F-box/leucine-rich repeat protein 10/11